MLSISLVLSTAYSLYLAQKFLVSLVFTGDRLEAGTHRRSHQAAFLWKHWTWSVCHIFSYCSVSWEHVCHYLRICHKEYCAELKLRFQWRECQPFPCYVCSQPWRISKRFEIPEYFSYFFFLMKGATWRELLCARRKQKEWANHNCFHYFLHLNLVLLISWINI